ncbi:putative membrane protein [Helicobacter pylori Hp P-25]|nr:putative membrane protein [Helicobacter pylori Hp P-25]
MDKIHRKFKNKKVLFSSKWVTKTFYGGYSVFLALVVSF